MVAVHPSTMTTTKVRAQSAGPVDARGAVAPLAAGALRIEPNAFLGTWQERNNSATIPHCIENLESSGVLHNFRRVCDKETGDFVGMWFADSDLYKTLEAIGWESSRLGRPVWGEFVDSAINLISRTQEADGYINTYVQGDATKTRWSNLVWSHELYCAGHMFQAAVALSRGADDHRLLDIALKFADCIAHDLRDRPEAFDGHAEVETALVELYRHTRHDDLLRVAQDQAERRGHRRLPEERFSSEYFGDHLPFRETDEVTGHAVRQLYFATGLVDLYLEDGDASKLEAAERLWSSAYSRKTYITGGQGSRHTDESFGDDYELPPDRAYAETCAAIASLHWNWRMLIATGEAKYAAEMEVALYNTIAASVADDGRHFFYTNPLQLRTGHMGTRENSPSERLSWFECACCPPNLARLVASLHNYMATQDDTGLQLQLLTSGTVTTQIRGEDVVVSVDTSYPWNGGAHLEIEGAVDFQVALRIKDAVAYRGSDEIARTGADGYLRFGHTAGTQDGVDVVFELAAEVLEPNPRIDAVRGCVALKRGPFVYCVEGVDHADAGPLEDLRLEQGAEISETSSTLPTVDIALTAKGSLETPEGPLYGAAHNTARPFQVTAIPYFAWGNRGQSSMRVWIPTAEASSATA
jgi:DUF1680 family protein